MSVYSSPPRRRPSVKRLLLPATPSSCTFLITTTARVVLIGFLLTFCCSPSCAFVVVAPPSSIISIAARKKTARKQQPSSAKQLCNLYYGSARDTMTMTTVRRRIIMEPRSMDGRRLRTSLGLSSEGEEGTDKDTTAATSKPPTERQQQPPPSSSPTTKTLSNTEMMRALGTSPRRILLGIVSSTVIALGGNFLGVTSGLLGLIPEDVVERSGLDGYYPRGDFKRYRSPSLQYTFLFPKEWLADPAILLAQTQRLAGAAGGGTRPDLVNRPFNLASSTSSSRADTTLLPDAAFGPPGRLNERGISTSDTNVSVITTRVSPTKFVLREKLGPPMEAAETLLRVSLAPEGSGRVGTLLAATEEKRGDDDNSVVYQMEYRIDRGGDDGRGGKVPLRAISVIAAGDGGMLITLTVVSPESDWVEGSIYEGKLRRVAESFKLTSSG